MTTRRKEEKLGVKNKLPSSYKRYEDDTLTIVSRLDINEANAFLEKLNSCHDNLKFTMDVAEQNTVSFVDMNLAKRGNRLAALAHRKSGSLQTLVYFFIITAMLTKNNYILFCSVFKFLVTLLY